MSTSTTNTAYTSPPPPSNGQFSMMNGLIPPPTTTAMPTTQQQQQPLAPAQFQQQQILQQKQQQQQTAPLPQPPIFNNNMNMSKFLPPNVALSPMASSTPNTTMSPNNLNLNGPMSNLQATKPTMPANNNIPTHLRPPGMMPPYSSASPTTAASSATLTNGSNGVASAQSSRTGSPALPPTTQQQRFGAPPPTTLNANTQALSNSMQNLNLQRTNGQPQTTSAAMSANNFQQQQRPTWNTNIATQAKVPPTVPGVGMPQPNFKTSALNAPDVVPTPTNRMAPMPAQGTNMYAGQQPPATSPFASQQGTTVAPPPPTSTQQPPASSAPTNRMPPFTAQPPSMFSTAGNPLSRPPPTGAQQSSAPTTAANTGAFMPPTSSAAAVTQQPPAPPVGITQQKRLYPQQTQMPPASSGMLQQQQQQQQYPYAQAYHQQPPAVQPPQQQQQHQFTSAPRSMFNGQPSSGPLQYQNQMSPMQQQQQQYAATTQPGQQQQPLNVVQQGFSRLWGQDTIDLMQNRHILTPATIAPPKVVLHNQFHESINCNPSIMRCTIAKIPESNSLLQKSRLPLGILIHPFRDINSLPVIQCPNIVRCRLCRTYINPFVYFVDSKMWKCNLCYRVNELPDDFQFDPATKTYGDVTRRPEVRSSTIEFIAPSEYMLRPPQPAIYLFLFDVSIIAQQCGYLENVCAMLSNHLDDMPGDARTQVGFIAFNSNVHFYSMADGYNQPHEMTLLDVDDVFLPRPDNLLVNLKECKELVKDLLAQLPKRFADTHDPGSALGAALQVAYKLMQASGGRVTVFQTCLPNKGPGSLEPREDPNNRSAKDVAHLNPATDFYKRYALECSGYQIAVDLFLLNQQYSDMATISGISKHSGGCVHHFPLYQKTKQQHVDAVKNCFKRYLTRKIGFEAVMRIRCTRGLQVHTFHGNFFVRSTDLLSLPNVNPDAGFGMQISYEESLTDVKTICFQAALLYTNSEGERRIRVHTLCLPVTASLPEVMHAADTEAIIGLLTKMAVDRSVTSNIADAREAFMNATVDILNAFKLAQNLPSGQTGQLIAPRSLALMPLYILALLKHPAFRVGTSTRLDDRVFAMDCMKTLPLDQLMKFVYPEFYNIDVLFYHAQNTTASNTDDDEDDELPDVPRLQLSAEYLDSRSIFLLDCGNLIILYVGLNVPVQILENVLGIKSTAELPDYCFSLPNLNTSESDALKNFIRRLNDEKPYQPIVQIIRDTSTAKPQFIEKLVDDRSESSLSYYEFLQHIRTQVK